MGSRGAGGKYVACRKKLGLLRADGRAAGPPGDQDSQLQLVDNDDGSWTLRCGGSRNSSSGASPATVLVACADSSGANVKILAGWMKGVYERTTRELLAMADDARVASDIKGQENQRNANTARRANARANATNATESATTEKSSSWAFR